MTRPVSHPLLSYYRRLAERWQAEARAQAERAASLQASLCKALETIERLTSEQHTDLP